MQATQRCRAQQRVGVLAPAWAEAFRQQTAVFSSEIWLALPVRVGGAVQDTPLQCRYRPLHTIFSCRCGGIPSTWLSQDFGGKTWNILNSLHIRTLSKANKEKNHKSTMTGIEPEARACTYGVLLYTRATGNEIKTTGRRPKAQNGWLGPEECAGIQQESERISSSQDLSPLPRYSLDSTLRISNLKNQILFCDWKPWDLICSWLSEEIFDSLQFRTIKFQRNLFD